MANLATGVPKTKNFLNVGWIQYCFTAAEVPADKLDGKATSHHDARRLRIAPDVVFGRRSDVAFATRRAAHYNAAAHFRRDPRPFLHRERDIRQRPQRDEYETRMSFNGLDDRIDGTLLFRRASWRRVAVIPQAIASVKPGRAYMRALQRLLCPRKNRDFRIA